MASRTYLRDKFKLLETEKDRRLFYLMILSQELWGRDPSQEEMLPEGYHHRLWGNVEGALNDLGRLDLWNGFLQALDRMFKNQKQAIPDHITIFFRELLGEFYPEQSSE